MTPTRKEVMQGIGAAFALRPMAAQPQQNRDGALTLWYRTLQRNGRRPCRRQWRPRAMVFGSVEHERLHSNVNQGEFLVGITF